MTIRKEPNYVKGEKKLHTHIYISIIRLIMTYALEIGADCRNDPVWRKKYMRNGEE
jgi:hypothetical protein